MTPDSKIKLLVFVPTLQCGGSEKYVSLLCDHIDNKRFDITLVVLNAAHPFYPISNKLIEVIDLGTKRARNSFLKIKKIVKEKQPDIILSTASHLNLFFAIFRRMFPKKMIVVARESSIVSINNRRAQFPGLYHWLTKRFYRNLDLIVCQSAFMQQDLISNFRVPTKNTVVIFNMVDEMPAGDHGNSANTRLPGSYKFITVARLSEEKGIDRLIRSVSRLSIPYQYHVIGEGKERGKLKDLIQNLQLKDKVFLSGEKIDPYHNMEDADLFLMGSHYEGSPNVLLEAGMLGIPVIAFDVPGGIGEIIKESENGLLVKDNDEIAFGAAIEKAVKMNFNRGRIMTDTKDQYSLNKIITEIQTLFIKLSAR